MFRWHHPSCKKQHLYFIDRVFTQEAKETKVEAPMNPYQRESKSDLGTMFLYLDILLEIEYKYIYG